MMNLDNKKDNLTFLPFINQWNYLLKYLGSNHFIGFICTNLIVLMCGQLSLAQSCNDAGDIVLYEEIVNGEITGNATNPLPIAMPSPFDPSVTYVVNGSASDGDRDAITFTVPAGSELSTLDINTHIPCSAIDRVVLWEGPNNSGTILFNSAGAGYVGGNIGPLGPGSYTLLINQAANVGPDPSCSITCYRIAFNFSCVPPGAPFVNLLTGEACEGVAGPDRPRASVFLPGTPANFEAIWVIGNNPAGIAPGTEFSPDDNVPGILAFNPVNRRTAILQGTAPIGTYEFCAKIRDRNTGCVGDETCGFSLTLNELPDGTISQSGPACDGEDVDLYFTATSGTGPYMIVVDFLNGGNPISATGDGSAFWTLSAPSVGSVDYELQSIEDNNGCSISTSQVITVVVNPLPVMTCPANTLACSTDGDFDLTSLSPSPDPSGGVFSGTGVSGNNFSPSTAGVGVHIITYTATDINGCSNTCTFDIEINGSPSAPVAEILTQEGCEGATGIGQPRARVFLPGLPADFEAIWVIGSNPAGITPGTEYAPDDSVPGILAFNSTNRRTIVLLGTAPTGTYEFCAKIRDRNTGCESAETCGFELTLIAIPVVTCPDDLTLCTSDSDTDMTTLLPSPDPSGGVFSGTGVSGNDFSPGTAGAGVHTITYTVTDGPGCSNSCTFEITVNPSPSAPIAEIITDEGCEDATGPDRPRARVFLPGTPDNFEAIWVIGSNPALIAPGTEFGPGDNVGGILNFNTTNRRVVLLEGTAPLGTYEFCAKIRDRNTGCVGDETCGFSLTLHELPSGSISNSSPVCEGEDVLFSFTATAGTGPYQIVVDGLNGGSPMSAAGDGSTFWTLVSPSVGSVDYELQSITDDNGCSITTSQFTTVVVNPLPIVICPADISFCTNEPDVDLTTLTPTPDPSGGVFTGTGVSGNDFSPSSAGVGTHTITYTVTDGNGCSNSCTFEITVFASPVAPVAEILTDEACEGATGPDRPRNRVFLPGDPADFEAIWVIGSNPAGITPGTEYGPDDSVPGILAFNSTNRRTVVVEGTAPVGTYEFCAKIRDRNNGCESTLTCGFEITLFAYPVMTCPADTSFCDTDLDVDLTTLSPTPDPSGGVFTGTGVSGNIFSPSSAGMGIHTITYTVTVGPGCSSDCTFDITVIASPSAPVPEILTDEACEGATGVDRPRARVFLPGDPADFEAVWIIGSNPAGITPGTEFNPEDNVAGVLTFNPTNRRVVILEGTAPTGIYEFCAKIRDRNTGCLSDETCGFELTLFPLPAMTCPADTSFCSDDPNVDLTTLMPTPDPSGGTFSGTGVSGNDFSPSTAGIGTHTITYSVTDVNGCTNSCTFDIEVTLTPSSPVADILVDEGCEGATGPDRPRARVFLPGDPADFEAIWVIGTNPAGLTPGTEYGPDDSVPGILAFNSTNRRTVVVEGTAPVGTYDFCAKIRDRNTGCESTLTCGFEVTLHPLPIVTCPSDVTYCESDADVDLTTLTPTPDPSGGVFTGAGVTGNNFSPSSAGAGTHTISYTFTDINGCSNTCTFDITVTTNPANPVPEILTQAGCTGATGADQPRARVFLPGDPADFEAIWIIGINPAGITPGTEYGPDDNEPGILGFNSTNRRTVVLLGTAPIGTYEFCARIRDRNTGCESLSTCGFELTLHPLPVVTCPDDISACTTDADVDLTSLTPTPDPSGGVFTGTGISGNDFNPLSAGVGVHTITYTVTDINGCVNSCTFNITVIESPGAPVPDLLTDEACEGVTGTDRPRARVFLPGDPADFEAVWIIGSNPAGITPGTEFGPGDNIAGVLTFNTTTRRVVILEGTAPTGTYEFCAKIRDRNTGCLSDETCGFELTLYAYPVATCPVDTSFCTADADVDLNSLIPTPDPAGGVFSGPGVSGDDFSPGAAGVGVHIITYTVTDGPGCSDECTFEITVILSPDPPVVDLLTDQACEGVTGVDRPRARVFLPGDPADFEAIWVIGSNPAGITPGTEFGPGDDVAGVLLFNTTNRRSVVVQGTAPVGTYIFCAKIRDRNTGCHSEAICGFEITLHELPEGYIFNSSPVCEGEDVTLGFYATAGTGPYDIVVDGLNGNSPITALGDSSGFWTLIAPAAGLVDYELLSITDANGCSSTISQFTTVEVYPLPTMTCPTDTAFCVTDADLNMTTLVPTPDPSGGTFSGTGVSGDIFSPSSAGLGIHTITYVFTDMNGCTDSCSFEITVDPIPSVTVQYNSSPAGSCLSGETICSNELTDVTFTVDNGDLLIVTAIRHELESNDGDVCPPGATNGYGPLTGGTIALDDNVIGGISQNIENNTGELVRLSFRVEPRSSTGGQCVGDFSWVHLIIEPTPMITCPADTTIQTSNNGAGDCTAELTWTHPTITGGCPPVTLEVSIDGATPMTVTPGDPITETFGPVGVYSIGYSVTDDGGNSSECSFLITVEDDELPIFQKAHVPDSTLTTDLNGATCPTPADINLVPDQINPIATGNTPFQFTVHGVTIDGPVVYSDNCSSGSDLGVYVWAINDDFNGPADVCERTIRVLWRVIDASGNSQQRQQLFTIIDDSSPDFPKPADSTLTTSLDNATCPETASISLTVDQVNPIATNNDPFQFTIHGVTIDGPTVYSDNCSIGSDLSLFVWNIMDDFDGPADKCERKIRVVWRVYDACGNFQARQQIFTIVDDSPPTFVSGCLGTETYTTDIDGAECPQDATITLTVGQIVSTTDQWEVGGVTAPSLNSCSTLDDNCSDVDELSAEVLFISVDDSELPCKRTITVGFQVSDLCGNAQASSMIAIYEIEDDIAPVLPTPPANESYQCESDVPAPGDLTAVDNCVGDITVTGIDSDNGGAGCPGDTLVITRTWTFDDGCGNVDNVSQTITVVDDTSPTFPKPADTTLTTDVDGADCPFTATTDLVADQVTPIATGNIAFQYTVAGVTVDGPTIYSDNCSSGVDLELYAWIINDDWEGPADSCERMIRVIWRVYDVCGNFQQRQQIFTIQDDSPPVTPAAPADADYDCVTDVPPPGDLTAIDNCSGDITATGVDTDNGGAGCVGDTLIITRTWTFVDSCGNASSVFQTISVIDSIPPDVVCKTDTVYLDEFGEYMLQTDDVINQDSSYDCSVITATSIMPYMFTCDDVDSTYTIDVEVSDECGNTSTCQATITIEEGDDLPPGWSSDLIGKAEGDASFYPCSGDGGTFEISSNGNPGGALDQYHFVHQTLCGNGGIIARVLDVTELGWLGVQLREDLSAGSRKASLKTQLNAFIIRSARFQPGDPAQNQQILRNRAVWLRLERLGNQFVGYKSVNGTNWDFIFAANIVMDSCIHVGLFVEGINNNSTAVGTFDNVIIYDTPPPLNRTESEPETDLNDLLKDQISLYPSPTHGVVYLETKEDILLEGAEIVMYNSLGQLISHQPLANEKMQLIQINEPAGIYFFTVIKDGKMLSSHRIIKH